MISDGAVTGAAAMKGDRLTRSLRIAVVVLVALGALSLGSVALAQEDYPPTPPGGDILGEGEGRGTTNDPNGSGVLPFTGGQFVLVIVAGAGLITIGTMLYRRSQRESGAT
jgi:hypothetical protein